jgi:malate dehydrogenase (oxaloacetate-decarboxylating)(NADP+)
MSGKISNEEKQITDQAALDYHSQGKPGKVSLKATKPMMTQRDLSLAYSPGVAVPCLSIFNDPDKAYDYTAKGNTVAVVSNGTAVLGLGKLGALASKPVMEGKAVLFKRFADIDGVDIEVDTNDADEFINCVKFLGKSWGGINLEDISAPECFIIEKKLKEIMDIPVFHDDQHGTAIISLAGFINATAIIGKDLKKVRIVVNGAGAAAIACIELLKSYGVPHDNVILCDTVGVIYHGRTKNMNEWKEAHAIDTHYRTLEEAMVGADVFLGLSVKGAISKDMIKSMADNPIIFALANPDPEILPEEVKEVRSDAIIATGRSDYPNQINNVMCFPFIFRGALDVRATHINEEMKIAVALSLAQLAREAVPEEVLDSYAGRVMNFGREYIIPVPFDMRLITTLPVAVAKAAMETGVAKKPITDFTAYIHELGARLDPTYSSMNMIFEKIKYKPRRIIFSEGEDENVIKAALLWKQQGLGTPILVGKEKNIIRILKSFAAVEELEGIEIWNAANISDEKLNQYIDYLYKKTHREGNLYRDCVRLVKTARNSFAACMLACGDGDGLVTGMTRGYNVALKEVRNVIDVKDDYKLFGYSMLISEGKTIFISDTTVTEMPTSADLADIAEQTAEKAKLFGHVPSVAMLSYSNFGSRVNQQVKRITGAIEELDKRNVNFEYDGEMTVEVALSAKLLKNYPFCKLTKPANVLIMPGLHTASISTELFDSMEGTTTIGPILSGLAKPVQILNMGSSVSEILNLAAFAAIESIFS